MRNFNINYNLVELYSNFEELELENKVDSSTTTVFAKINNSAKVNNSAKANVSPLKVNNLVLTILYSTFDSLCLPYVASKQTHIVIQNKPMTKIEDKLNKVHIDL